MPLQDQIVIDELRLDGFRELNLSEAGLLGLILENVRVLLRLPVGVGKTHAAQKLLSYLGLYGRFDLVIYAAPAWNILSEVIAALDVNPNAPPRRVLRARPRERCGDLDAEWSKLEQQGCSALAKGRLCLKRCPVSADCSWPSQMSDLGNTRLILMTDQRISLVPNIVALLKERGRYRRVLVILDEASLLDASLEVLLARKDINQFINTLRHARCKAKGWPEVRDPWMVELANLQSANAVRIQRTAWSFPAELHAYAFNIQAAGLTMYGDEFRYIGYELSLLASSRPEERWRVDEGVRFIGRPYLDGHLALLSANLSPQYASHRLGVESIASPFEHHRFLHSGTHVYNIRNASGAASHFHSHKKTILDTFAVLIARNIATGRTTLLISRLKWKALCAEYLAKRLAEWGHRVRFVTDDFGQLPQPPSPTVVPIIHYGIRGTNNFTGYESAYCLNSYYVNGRTLNKAVQEFEPRHFRVELEIVHGPDRQRRVRLANPVASDEDRTWLGSFYLRKLEVDPVIQAAGRVRFLTKPREVVFFQMDDLSPEIGRCQEVAGTVGLREILGVPSAKEIDHVCQGKQAVALLASGMPAEDAAARIGISRASLFRRLESLESLKTRSIDTYTRFETPAGLQGTSGGVS